MAIDMVKGIARAWVMFKGTSTVTIQGTPFGVDSITDNATGDYQVNWAGDFSNYTYVVSAVSHVDNPVVGVGQGHGMRTSDCSFATGANASLATGGNRSDTHRLWVVAYGVKP
jgi:hypothetical protein